MDPAAIASLLQSVRSGQTSIDDALERLRKLPFEEVGDVGKLDHHRELRSGVPEVVYGESKSAEVIAELLERLAKGRGSALATRVSPDKAATIVERVARAEHRERARSVIVPPAIADDAPTVAVVAAGTSDVPVAAEVAVTLEFIGLRRLEITDVGVAGLPRTIDAAPKLAEASAVVVVAGMEGALPGVLAGLTDRPIIAVPTSVGYGVGFGGYVAMMAMLASCSPGVTVVNIDNGFGAAVAAARIALQGRRQAR